MTTATQTRILVVDDNEHVLEALHTLSDLYEDIVIIGEARTGEEAVILAGQLQPDVVIMDILLPRNDGIEATRQIRQEHPHIRVIILTSAFDKDRRIEAFEAGASDYLLKIVSLDTLYHAIRAPDE
jgi:DNA-binding NarL/FixJ family response regulator